MRINKDSDGSRIIHIIPLSSFELLNIDWQNVISSGMLNMLGLAFYFKASSQATFLTICLDSGGNMPSMNNPGKQRTRTRPELAITNVGTTATQLIHPLG